MEEFDFTIEEATVKQIQQAFSQGKLTSPKLVNFYLHNQVLRGVIEVNPTGRGKCVKMEGELHGIPVLLKGTIGTNDDLNTTAGSYALLGSKIFRDATVVERLRKGGAIILGKTIAENNSPTSK